MSRVAVETTVHNNFDLLLQNLHTRLRPIWPEGRERSCSRNDGPHFTLDGYDRPASVGQVEARLLYNLSSLRKARTAFEIGTGFGYSSLWMGGSIFKNHGESGWVGSLDNYGEGGLGKIGLEFAKSAAIDLGLERIIHYMVGSSPSDIGALISQPIDIAFIDGDHNRQQPSIDYLAIRPHLSDSATLVFHDVQSRYTVAEAIAHAVSDGWSPIVFPTSCRMCVCYKTVEDFDVAIGAFEAAKAHRLL